MEKRAAHDTAAWKALIDRVAGGLEVRTDSRQVRPGDVFVAVPGAAVDGARFIPMALEKGAAFVVAATDAGWPSDAKSSLVLHGDPRNALGELAAARHGTARLPFKLAGVTGTNG
ncbi:MAG: Mur ligase domain-containing protein, partial [Thermodesulfobacteriota bacterium]